MQKVLDQNIINMTFFKKILVKYFLPELKSIFINDLSFNENVCKIDDVNFEDLTKIYRPYKLNKVTIGKGTYISSNSKISNTTIGKFCSIGPNLFCGWGIHPIDGISTHPYFYSLSKQNGSTIAKKNLVKERKKIIIGNDVFIGANVIILDGVTIGDGVVIGAGSIVSKDLPDFAVAVGSPIRIIKYRFTEIQRKELKEIAWWNFDNDLYKVNEYFFDIDTFIINIKKNNRVL